MAHLTAYKAYPARPPKVSCARIAVVFTILVCAGHRAAAQQPDTAELAPSRLPRLRLQFPGDSIRLWPLPPSAAGRTLRNASRLVPDAWLEETRWLLALARRERVRARLLAALEREPAPGEEQAPTIQELTAGPADLGFDITAHLEIKMDELRNARCAGLDVGNPAVGCAGGFSTPAFDQQFRVRAGGVVSERLNVNVDFDSEREFDANNNIHLWYEGLDDEVLRRVEIGNVSLRAPPSRFITAAIPANSFGVQAEARWGPLEIHSILAQQKGSALRSRLFTVGEATTLPVQFEIRDLDFETGRFFWTVNPLALRDYPAVDILELDPDTLPPALQVAQLRLYRLQAQTGRTPDNPNLSGITAVALRRDSPQRVGPFTWELLVEGRDYYLDPTRLWFALARRLSPEEFLAVSYVTVSGDTVGTFPAVNTGTDTLELLFEPRRGPEAPTFWHEIRSVYRLGGRDVVRSTIALAIVVNESERPLDGIGTYLSRLGLSVVTDPSTVDEYNRVFPRLRDPDGGAPIRDLFVIFPHLQPFADSARLLPAERNDSLYRTPTYLLASQGPPPRFVLRIVYEATGAGDRAAVALGALQIRPGSETVFAGDRQLVRGRHYEVDYALGQVRFLNPDSLFFGPTQVRVQFEENLLLDLAAKSVMGMATTYHLGARNRVHAIAMFQRDRSAFLRPQLGFEPASHFIGGLSTELQFRPDGLTRVLDALPLLKAAGPSQLTITGEVALSQPNPNQLGVAYVEDFQGEATRAIPLNERGFQLGSAPSSGRGLDASYLGTGGAFRPEDAVPLAWQNAVLAPDGRPLEFAPRDIDSTIALTGAGFQVEPVLWLSLLPDTVGGAPDPQTGHPRWMRPHSPGPRWRSLTQPLGGGSGVGVDLSRMEFLEFWVLEDAAQTARREGGVIVFDLGTVFEDAVAPVPEGFRVADGDTVFTGFRLEGAGRLDTEKDTLTNVFNAQLDDRGIHADFLESILNETTGELVRDFALCDRQGVFGEPVLPRGDLRAVCTRGNGRLDTEDLDGDNRLDRDVGAVEEHALRYVFAVGDPRYYVRDGLTHLDGRGRPLTWRLYRIPFRTDTIQIGRPNIRQVQALRLTVVAPARGPDEPELFVALARMRLMGAPWLKRAASPIAGLSGARGEPHGEVVASVVSTENRDLGYTSPPGVGNQADRLGAAFELGLRQINEKSLRLLARDLRVDERAEVFVRFADEADRNFLAYRELRVWARGRGPGWEEGDLEFFVKVGLDEHNFYLYRSPLRTDTWEPEVVVALERWLGLRAAVEAAWLRGEPPSGAAECGGDSTAYVACDQAGYLVQVRDPGVAPPNLARVSELAVGMLRTRQTVAIDQAELWVNDIRLGDAVDDVGVAAALDARLAAADVAEVSLSVNSRDDRFHQLGQDPSYVTDVSTRLGGVFRAEKLLPESWGVQLPVMVQHVRARSDPFYVSRSDVRADALPNLRRPRRDVTAVEVALRRVRQGEGFLERAFLDPIAVRVRRESASDVASRNRSRTENRHVELNYHALPGSRSVAAVPGFLVKLLDALPDWVRDSEFGRALRAARLRLNPYQLRFRSALTDNVTRRFAFRVPVELPADSAAAPLTGIVHTWRNEVGVDLRPFSTLSLRVGHVTLRDLQNYGDSTAVGRLLEGERRAWLGQDVGFERERRLTTALHVAPVVSGWLRPRLAFTSRFALSRDPNARTPVAAATGAATQRVPEALSNARTRELGASLDLARLVPESGIVGAVVRAALPADVSHRVERHSSFDRAPFAPDLRYHLALGGLDEFRFQEGVPATAARELQELTVTGGARLPLGGRVRLGYRDARHTLWARRAERHTEIRERNREWPSATLSWVHAPRGALAVLLTNLNAQLRYQVNTRTTVQPALRDGPAVRTEISSTLVVPSVTVSWAGGVSTTAQLTVATTEQVAAGNLTRSDRRDWSGSLSFGFRPPPWLGRFRDEFQTRAAFTSSAVAVCLRRPGADGCRTVSDSRRQQLDLRVDTGLSELVRGGLTFSYVLSDQRHISSKLSQVVFTAFADINLLAGRIR